MEKKYRCKFENEYWTKIACADNKLLSLVESFSDAHNLKDREKLWKLIAQHIATTRELEHNFLEWLTIMQKAREKLDSR